MASFMVFINFIHHSDTYIILANNASSVPRTYLALLTWGHKFTEILSFFNWNDIFYEAKHKSALLQWKLKHFDLNSIQIVSRIPINNKSVLVQKMARRRPGEKPSSEPMMASLLTHICVTWPQWVNDQAAIQKKSASQLTNIKWVLNFSLNILTTTFLCLRGRINQNIEICMSLLQASLYMFNAWHMPKQIIKKYVFWGEKECT